MEVIYEGHADLNKIHEFIDKALQDTVSGQVKVTISIGVEAVETTTIVHPVGITHIPRLSVPEEMLKSGTLRPLADGTLRTGDTRVPLDTVIGEFNDGATPEEIVQQFPTLELADVYAVIAFYLREKQAVDAYLNAREIEGERKQRKNEARFNQAEIRERLLARHKAGKNS